MHIEYISVKLAKNGPYFTPRVFLKKVEVQLCLFCSLRLFSGLYFRQN